MSRLELFTPSKDQLMVESLYKNTGAAYRGKPSRYLPC